MGDDTRLVAVLSGDDWSDAAVDVLRVSGRLDLEMAMKAWRQWYCAEYKPAHRRQQRIEYLSFVEFLKRKYDAMDASEELEVFDGS